jgi:methyl-accepting chemotaxis protein
VRTAAASGVATGLLAREDASELALIGPGAQGRQHLLAMNVVRPLTQVRIYDPNPELAERFRSEMQPAVAAPIQVARSAEDQANRVTASAEVTDSMSQASRAVTELANNVHRDASGATAAAAAGSETVTRNATGMEALSRAMESAAANLEALGARSEQIGEVVTTINSFAGQTNLLALNAAIEAARAGEAGRGFAVVAQEVRTLSEQSTKATNEIAALIAEVQTGIRESVAGMRMATRQTADSMGLSRAAGASLEQIRAAVGETTKRVSEILGQSERLDGHSRELVSTISELAAMTEENSAAAAEIARVSEEVLGNARQLGNDAKARAEAAAKVLSATQGITELIAKLTASAGTLDHLAADLAAATGSAA